MKVLLWDCPAGIAGDMALASLIDAGINPNDISGAFKGTGLDFSLRVETVISHGIRATRAIADAPAHQPHRRLNDITQLIARVDASEQVKASAMRIFTRLAEAEGRVHGVHASEIHFHEVGAVDAIVEVVGTCLAIEMLGIGHLYVSPLPLGHGFTVCHHGRIPLPAPAALELLRGLPVYQAGFQGETVTPTGAAIVSVLATRGTIPEMTVANVGYGAGASDFGFPNVARAVMGEVRSEASLPRDEIVVLETTIDDLDPEIYPETISSLLAHGARDAFVTPIVMKKGRPAVKLTVLAYTQDWQRLAHVIIEQTGTLGVRMRKESRLVVPRRIYEVATPYGPVRVKASCIDGKPVRLKPEFEDCRSRALDAGVTVREVREETLTRARRELADLFPKK